MSTTNSPINDQDLYSFYSGNRSFIDVPAYSEKAERAAEIAVAAALEATAAKELAEQAEENVEGVYDILYNMTPTVTLIPYYESPEATWNPETGELHFDLPFSPTGGGGAIGDILGTARYLIEDITIFNGTDAMSFGDDVEIADGVTITIEDNATWRIGFN